MKLILIYGPPAVGKLTVSKALQALTGFQLLHNHMISDLVLSILERGTPAAADLNHRIRCLIYEAAAKSGQEGLISTVLYRYDIKDQIHNAVNEYKQIVEKYGGEMCVIQLSSDAETLKKRVVTLARVGTNKISTVEKLSEVLEKEDLLRTLPEEVAQSLRIDNTHLSPEEVAERIKSHYHL